MRFRLLGKILDSDDDMGNVLVMGVVTITILSIFSVVMVSRMIIDAHTSANRVLSSKAFYLADGGIQWGRRYLANGDTIETDLGPISIGDGAVSVQIRRTQIRYPSSSSDDQTDVYSITSTAAVGSAIRQIEEFRYRDPEVASGKVDKEFLLWRDAVADEF